MITPSATVINFISLTHQLSIPLLVRKLKLERIIIIRLAPISLVENWMYRKSLNQLKQP